VVKSAPVDCDLESAKQIGVDVVDQRTPVDEVLRQG
jgi:hypothetical protein